MTVYEARKIVADFDENQGITDEDEFMFTEAMNFLIEEEKNPDDMMYLGGYYYEQKHFDLALKYYEMAAEYGDLNAIVGLGYIWYYGRTGERNFEKAFYYYDKARKAGDPVAAYKVADMYRNGYYVDKDLSKFREIIEDLYPKVKDLQMLGDPVPEVSIRLAKIRTEEGKTEEALRLYEKARNFLEQRIRVSPFFGNLNIMKWMIEDIYKLKAFDEEDMRLYDLYYALGTPVRVRFTFEQKRHEVEAVEEDGAVVIRFDDHWYRTVDDFFQKAELDGELLTSRYEELYGFEVVK